MISLPDVPLQYLLGYLTVNDVINLRLTCSRMFQVSKCKEFYGKVQIRMSNIKDNDVELFQTLCDEFASNVRFSTEGCFEERLSWILPYVENIKDILVNIRYLRQVCTEVKYIKHLVISYICTDDLKNDDINFCYLSMATELDHLSIKGTSNNLQKLHLYQPMLYDIFKHTKQISKISFDNIQVENDKTFKQDSLSNEIKNSSHITEWHLNNVVAPDDIFNLPKDIRILECRNTNCINFRNYEYNKIQKLSLESVYFENTVFRFENLKILEITGHLLGDDLDRKTVICPKLEILRLYEIHHIRSFLNFLTVEMETLHMSVIDDISQNVRDWILRINPSIKKIILSEVKHEEAILMCQYRQLGKSKNSIFLLSRKAGNVEFIFRVSLVKKKLQHFLNDGFQSYYDLFQVNCLIQNL